MKESDLTPEAYKFLVQHLGLESLTKIKLFGRGPLTLEEVLHLLDFLANPKLSKRS
jgi:hypothetical protein